MKNVWKSLIAPCQHLISMATYRILHAKGGIGPGNKPLFYCSNYTEHIPRCSGELVAYSGEQREENKSRRSDFMMQDGGALGMR